MVRSLEARRYGGLSGLAVVVLFGVGSAIWGLDMPEDGTPVAEVADFYRETSDRIVIGASLSLLAIGAFVLFAAAVRSVLAEAEGDDLLATTAFGGALLGMAAGLGAETINMVAALRARDDELSDALAQSLFEISQILGSTATGLGLGVFALATAAAALRTGLVLPRWLAVVTGVIGISLLTPLSHVNVLPGAAMVLIALLIAVAFLWRPVEERSTNQASSRG
jgi:hypothetical protein